MEPTAALIVAAGRGLRAGAGGVPKQYQLVGGISVLARSLGIFLGHPAIGNVAVVIGEGDEDQYAAIAPQNDRLMKPIHGGATRQDSVRLGLAALAPGRPANVLIHDAARPFASRELVQRVVDGLRVSEAILPVLPVADTLKAVDAAGIVTATVPRDGLYAAATPQGFRFSSILDAHQRAAAARLSFTDDAGIAEWAGIPVHTVTNDPGNMKLTTARDLAAANWRIAAEAALARGDVRVGTGYDVHAFGSGSEVMLGGIAIPHSRGVIGHSDGDVVLHALTDAVLGALAEGDIGDHFPPSDPQWRGASSDRFLRFAAERVAARNGRIAHLDAVIIAEAPRIAGFRDAMRARIAAICGITSDRVGVKATTNESLGFVGREEGIAAMATATIRLPFTDAP